jgi:hypothetical protein
MPPGLWAAAVALTRQHGLYRTARALRLDYGALKRHADAVASPASAPTFVELAGAVPRPVPQCCTIEIAGTGAMLRLCLSDLSLAEVATLGRRLAGLEP